MRKLKLFMATFALVGGSVAAMAQKVGDVITVDGSEYEVTGANLISNASFDDGVTGWYTGGWAEANPSKYTLQTEGGFDEGPYLQYSAGGAGADTNIRGKWSVENGKMYLFRCYTSGKTPDSNNLQYSKLMIYDESKANYESDNLYQLTWGAPAGQESTTWTENNFVFTASSDMVCFRSSWTNNAKLDGFFLGEVKRYISPDGYNKALQAAKDAIESADFVNVTGQEKDDLQQAITDYTGVSSDQYEQAIEALEAAVKTFKGAKSAYDGLATANAAIEVELPYAASSKKPTAATATTATEATAATASVYTALRAYYESNAMAEGKDGAVNVTDLIKNPLAENGNKDWTWDGKMNDPASKEPWTDASGNSTHKYFDGGNWGANSWTTKMSQTLSLPAGKYLLTAKGRAALNTTLTLAVGENSKPLPNVGSTGNVFDRGWGDASVEFTTDGSDATITVTASSETVHEWFSVSDFRLVRLELHETYADADDYAALNAAIEEAEKKTLGFEDGEYAPYNNVDALKALAAAKALNQESENGQENVQALTTALTEATWTANSGEVNAIYDGTLAKAPIQATTENVVLPGWTTESGNTRQTFSGADSKASLADAIDNVGLFVHPGTYTYGNMPGYTLPLKAGTYVAEAKYCAWQNESNKDFTLTLKKNGETVAEKSYGANNIACDVEGALRTVKLVFNVEEAGDFILSVTPSGNTFMTDFFVKKATPESVTVGSAGYATYVGEYDLDFSASAIKAYTAKVADGKVVLTQIEKVAAGTPVVLCCEGGKTEEIPFANTTDTPAESDLVAGDGAKVATTDDTYTNYILNVGTQGIGFYQANDQTVDKGRAYLHVAGTSEARLAVVFGDATGISSVKAAADGEAVYNLNGQRVKNASKGLFIIGGKKVVVK